MARGRWVYSKKAAGEGPSESEKREIGQACEAFIVDVLKPRFLPEIRPTDFNYPVDIFGKWHGRNYRFIQRYRSGFEDNLGSEFDAPFSRLEYVSRDRFNLSYFRHTGQWWTLYRGISLTKALSLLESEGILHPVC